MHVEPLNQSAALHGSRAAAPEEWKRDELFRLVAERTDELVAFCDAQGYFTYASPSFGRVLGYLPAELSGHSLWSLAHPHEVAAFWDTIAGIVVGQTRSWQLRARHANGSWRWVDLKVTRVVGDEGSSFVVIGRDVTEQRQGEEQLAEANRQLEQRVAERTAALAALAASEAFYRTLIDVAPQVIWFADASGRVTFVNPNWYTLHGLNPEEALDRTWPSQIHPHDRDAVVELWAQAVASGEPFRTTHRVVGARGYRTVSSCGVAVRDAGGAITSWVGVTTDITEQVQAEEALLEANRELEAFSYSVSHDLRAPLRQIEGFLSVLASHQQGNIDPIAGRYMEAIRSAAGRMDRLITDLLNFSRSGRAELQLRPVDMGRLLTEARHELSKGYAERRACWEIGTLPVVQGAPALLRLVLNNLLDNALKYSSRQQEPRIVVTSSTANGLAVIHIQDNGVGFDMAQAHRLFDVFQRLHSAQEFDGTGIGLATVRRIIQRHGGQIWVWSEPGCGARFSFSLPAASLVAPQ